MAIRPALYGGRAAPSPSHRLLFCSRHSCTGDNQGAESFTNDVSGKFIDAVDHDRTGA
jgi:hypothetical protein